MTETITTRLATLACVALALGSGCAMQALRPHVQDHYAQVRTMADACRSESATWSYAETPCSEQLQTDLDAMAAQAECMLAITEGKRCPAN